MKWIDGSNRKAICTSATVTLPPGGSEAHRRGGLRLPRQRYLHLFLVLLLVLTGPCAFAEETKLTVGVTGTIEQVILPGSELIVKPITDRLNPLVLRIAQVFPHGDSFRYDLHYQGLEPGKHNLIDYLARKDGSAIGDIPPIEIEVHSLLPPGQVIPNPVREVPTENMGGYTPWAIAAATLWGIGLLCLIFGGRRRQQSNEVKEKHQTLGDLIQDRLQAAKDNRLTPGQYAELERLLLTFWRRRLDLEHLTLEQSTKTIRNHADAGPLVKRLERWMHAPSTPNDSEGSNDSDLAKLIEPYHAMPVDLMETAS